MTVPLILVPTAMKAMTADTYAFAQSRYTRCMVVRDTNQLSCAGGNDLGIISEVPDADAHPKLSPRVPFEMTTIYAVGAGDYHVCALDDAGGAWCWGGSFLGQLGNGAVDAIGGPEACLLTGAAGARGAETSAARRGAGTGAPPQPRKGAAASAHAARCDRAGAPSRRISSRPLR